MTTAHSETGIIFQENQYFDKWQWFFAFAGIMTLAIIAILLFIFAVVPEIPSILLIIAGIPVFLFAILGFVFSKIQMTTEIRDDGLHIRYSPTQLTLKRYPLNSIESYEKSKGGLLVGIIIYKIRRYHN